MDDFGPNDFGRDGTQAPPPPRFFPDPLAGLVTGADRVFPDALSGSTPLEPAPSEAAGPAPDAAGSGGAGSPGVGQVGLGQGGFGQSGLGQGAASGPRLHDPTGYRQSHAAALRRGRPTTRRPTAQPVRSPQVAPPVRQGWNSPQGPPPSPYAYPTAQAPAPNAPTQYVPPHAPLAPRAAPHQARPAQTPQKTGAGWVGCLVVLAVLGGLLFPVARAIIEALVRLFS
ncbi:MAG: hypothetical protein HOY78_47955 [Saccharothrix sp.]|nr:hypothetical protein [Saccharothrix sp.]